MRIYLSKNHGTEVNLEGWNTWKELCSNVLPEIETATSPSNAIMMVGGSNNNTSYPIYASYEAFNSNATGGLALHDSSNSRFCAYLSDFNTVSEIGDEHENDIYIDVDEYDEFPCRYGLSIIKESNEHNSSNLDIIATSSFSYSDIDLSEEEVTPSYAKNHLSASGSISYRLLSGYGNWHKENLTFWCNIPLFLREEDARQYIETGTKENCITSMIDEQEETYPEEYYFDEVIYRYDKAMKNKTAIEKINNYYQVDRKIVRMIGYISENVPHNIVFKAKSSSSEVNNILCSHQKDFGQSYNPTITVFNLMQSDYNRCGLKGEVSDSTYIYYAMPHTNIPITTSESEADSYLEREKELDEIETLNPTYPPDYNYKHTGDDTGEQDTQVSDNTFAEPFLSTQYILNYSQMEEVSNLLFSSEPETLTEILNLLKMYGENPISDVVDLVHIPINIEDFVSTDSGRLKFASYVSNITGRKITAHGRLKTLGSTQISPIYNDFRDYTNVQISLYLPFCAIIPLDIQLFMNSTITIKASLDSRSHNLRYYIFCSNGNGTNLVEYHDCSIGKSCIVMGNDTAGKMKQNVMAVNGIINEQINSNISMGTALVKGVASLNPERMIDSGLDVIGMGFSTTERRRQGLQEVRLESRMTQATKTFSGSQSSGVAENDILYPYLIFKIQQSILPSKLRETYGSPTNIVTKLSNVSGFTMCDNLKLQCGATENELNEIYALAQSGIIL